MAPPKRFARRETTQRTFTFVRNWNNIAHESQESSQEPSGSRLNKQALISPVPQILSDSDHLSTSDIVNQSPVPIIVSHVANQSKHLQNEDDYDGDEQDDANDEDDYDDDEQDDANDEDDDGEEDIENYEEHPENISSHKQSQAIDSFQSPRNVHSQTKQTKSVTHLSPACSPLQKQTKSSARNRSSIYDGSASYSSRKSDGNVSITSKKSKTDGDVSIITKKSKTDGHVSTSKKSKTNDGISSASKNSKTDGNVSTASKKSKSNSVSRKAETDDDVLNASQDSNSSSLRSKGKTSSVSSRHKGKRKIAACPVRCEKGSNVIAGRSTTPSRPTTSSKSTTPSRPTTPSSLWQARRVTRCVKKNVHTPSHERSARKDSSMVMASDSPVEPVKKTAVARVTGRQTRHQSVNADKAVETIAPLQDDDDAVRRGSDVLDLDVIYECIGETEQEILDEASSQTSVKAVKKVLDVTRKELRKTISQVHKIKVNQAQILKKKSMLKRLRTDLREIQHDKRRLRSEVAKLRKRCRVDNDLLQISDWLCEFSKLQKQWFNSTASKEHQILEDV